LYIIQGQNIPMTASGGVSFGGADTSYTRTENPYFEKRIWSGTPLGSQSVSEYLDNISHSMSASVIGSLADEIPVRKTAFAREITVTLYELVLALRKLMTISNSSISMLITAIRKLDELKNLPEDWDSYGADPISPNAIAKAKSIIISVVKSFSNAIGDVVQLTDVIPIADGGVQLEWVGPHAELEIEISPNGTIGLLYISGSGDRRNYEESEDNSINDISAMIARLIHSQYNN
jgi:hypothetical protein